MYSVYSDQNDFYVNDHHGNHDELDDDASLHASLMMTMTTMEMMVLVTQKILTNHIPTRQSCKMSKSDINLSSKFYPQNA